MKHSGFIAFAITVVLWNNILAQDFSGKYLMQAGGSELTLILENKGGGNYGGSISGNENTYLLQCIIQNGLLQGTIGDDLYSVTFIDELNNDVLTLVMAETDKANQPVLSTAQTLIFNRESMKDVTAKQYHTAGKEVIVNDIILSKEQIEEIARMHGIPPQPGNYNSGNQQGYVSVPGHGPVGYGF